MDIPSLMIRFNEWWKTGNVRNEYKMEKKRTLFNDILQYLPDRQILGITGLRRTGKTTLMYQFISHLINNGTDPKNILFFSFDEILALEPDIIEILLDNFQNLIRRPKEERLYIFIDEVQYIYKWEAIVKRYYDLYPEMKFFISGSASLQIKKAKESLVGRLYEFELNPLNFHEFLLMKEIHLPETLSEFDYQSLEKKHTELFFLKDEIRSLLNEYLIKGGFPEMLEEESIEKIHKYLRTNTDRIIFQDITKMIDIREPALLIEMLKIIASQSGHVIDYQNLAKSLKVTRQTISNYMLYLQESFLIKILTNYTGSYLVGTRKAKKFYIQDHALMNMLLGHTDEIFSDAYTGIIIENICINHLDARYFWRKDYEVDIVLTDKKIIPVEIKYRNDPDDIKGLIKFIKKFDVKYSVVITKDTLKIKSGGNEIIFIPAWLLLSIFLKN